MSEIVIKLAGEATPLRYSLRAVKDINRVFGDFLNTARRLEAFDFNAFVAVVAAGLNKKATDRIAPNSDTKMTVEEAVGLAGMTELVNPLGDYVMFLSRGGRPVPTTGDGEDEQKGNE